jgi:hypothetical protein
LMIQDLLHGGWAHIYNCQALQMSWEDFLGVPSARLSFLGQTHHRPPPALRRRSVGAPAAG